MENSHNSNSRTANKITFWSAFIVIIGLIVWGMIAASTRSVSSGDVSNMTLLKPAVASDWSIGSSTASVTIVEYADFQCPACGDYQPVLKKLLDEDGSKIFFIYRHFPLPQHANAVIAAEASEAAGIQGKFWEMHDMLFAHQKDWENVGDPTPLYVGYAKAIGINAETFAKDIVSKDVHDKVIAGYREAGKNNLDHTPTIFINGKEVSNPGYDGLKKMVDDAAQTKTTS